MKWFRFYSQVLHDSKVQTLPRELFWAWVNLLCIANEAERRGSLPDLKQIAFLLRVTGRKARQYIDHLKAAGLLDEDTSGSWRPHDWEQWQSETQGSNERVRRYRERIRASGETVSGYTQHRAAVHLRDGGACVYCLTTDKLVLDHLVPVQRGGDGEPDNLVTACRACNSGKSGRLVEECGYVIRRAETVTQYEAVKSRLGVTVTPVPVTPVTVTVTPVSPRARVDLDSDSDSDTDSDTDGGGNSRPPAPARIREAGAIAADADAAVEEARVRFGDRYAAVVRDNAADIDATLGGRFDLYLAALERSRTYSRPIANLHGFAITLASRYALTGVPPPPVAVEPATTAAHLTPAQQRQAHLSNGIKAAEDRIKSMDI